MAIPNVTGAPRGQSAYIETIVLAGRRAYALGIVGNALDPEVADGQCGIFDPDAGPGRCGDVAAIWVHGRDQPTVVRLASAIPPFGADEGDNITPILLVETDRGTRSVEMSRIARVDVLVEYQAPFTPWPAQ